MYAVDCSDINPIVKDSWNKIRDSILQVFVNKHLIPSLEQVIHLLLQYLCIRTISPFNCQSMLQETKRELLRVGRENIIEEASQHFSKLLQIGPYRPIHPLPDVRVHRDISSPGIHLNHVIGRNKKMQSILLTVLISYVYQFHFLYCLSIVLLLFHFNSPFHLNAS